MNKPLLSMTVGALALGGLLIGTATVAAQDTATNQPTIVQRIATRFNLQESDVQAVFDEDRQQRHEQMEQLMADRLSTAVSEGKLTEDQKQLILDKHEEMQQQMLADRDQFRALTPEERRDLMQERRTALEAWATEHGIDLSYVAGGPGGMMGKGGRMHGGIMGEGRWAN